MLFRLSAASTTRLAFGLLKCVNGKSCNACGQPVVIGQQTAVAGIHTILTHMCRFRFGHRMLCSDDDSEAGEHEDADAKSQRLARARRQDDATAAHFGSAHGSAPGDTPAAVPAVDLPTSRPDSTAQPSDAALTANGMAGPQNRAATPQQAADAAQLSTGRRNDRLFGGGPSAPQQQGQQQQQGQLLRPQDVDAQRGGVSIGPAGRVVSASLASGPAAAAAAAPAGRGGAAEPAAASVGGRHRGGAQQAEAPAGGSEDEGNDALPSDAMRPAPGAMLTLFCFAWPC